MGTTRRPDLEHNKYIGQVSAIMRLITIEYGDILSRFDKIEENNIDNTSLKQKLFNNHDVDANRGRNRSHLPLEHMLGFCKTFQKITENLGFHFKFKTAELQVFIYATLGVDNETKINIFYLFLPAFKPSAETQAMFYESIKISRNISIDSWYTGRKVIGISNRYW